ncbi:transmembrane protein 119b [Austrofundulus limnaeus]|uniref:Transmembrane protein 119-like n=1 Tax=Austrofundulus limnaeus TaxID=52670 RepID=A0A2I4AUP2_AUSLI|nr:PREDICTED: transmembrane protein 119-like [Austrofundulus limnaeus]XP_013859209.1 PREDICTED: transmembrane protein 119-like [Austrofundulus limnaeus]
MGPAGLHPFGLCLVFHISRSLATPLSSYGSLEGSTDEEEFSSVAISVSTAVVPTKHRTTPADPSQAETGFPKELVSYLEENLLLILVGTTLSFLFLLITCGAFILSRKRKVNSYYPSSFPSKMYVDRLDKTGGAKPFNEVQEKAAPEQECEPLDSHRQLQAEILRAASSLRTPNKKTAESSEPRPKAADHRSEDSSKPDGSIVDQQLPSLPEEEQEEAPDSRAAGARSATLDPAEQPFGKEDLREASTGRGLRPSSLHIHNDTATLQLIAGEKTAF